MREGDAVVLNCPYRQALNDAGAIRCWGSRCIAWSEDEVNRTEGVCLRLEVDRALIVLSGVCVDLASKIVVKVDTGEPQNEKKATISESDTKDQL